MDAVQAFDIEVDTHQFTKLYDYGRGLYLMRPDEGWDHQAIADTSRQAIAASEEDEDMIKRLDKILTKKGLLEKSKQKEDEKGLKFDKLRADADMRLPMRVLPVLTPGDVISGQLVLEVVEALEAEQVKIRFRGMASTNHVHSDGKHTHHVRGFELYVRDLVVVWQKVGSQAVEEGARLSSAVKCGDKISPGRHTFPFSFRVPLGGLQSVPPLVKDWDGDYAHIAYYIKATIDKGNKMSRGNIVTHRGLWVETPYDIGQHPENLTPMVHEQTQETGLLTKGKITCRATLPAYSYIRGRQQQVPLELEIDNQSGGPIDSVKACVILHGYYRTNAKHWHGTRSVKFQGARVKEGTIASGMCPQMSFQIPLSFEEDGLDGNLIPAGNLEDCEIIDVRYYVRVVLKRKGLHRNMELRIPILIGTENSQDSLYPALGKLNLETEI